MPGAVCRSRIGRGAPVVSGCRWLADPPMGDAWPLVIEFPPPGPLLNLNDRMHWAKRARLTAAWREAAHIAALQSRKGGPSQRRLPDGRYRVTVTLPTRAKRRTDPSNFLPSCKAAIDGAITDAGLLPDDSSEWVTVAEPIVAVGVALVRIEIEPV